MIATRCFTFQLHHEPESIFEACTWFSLRLQCEAVQLSVAAAEEEEETLTHLWLNYLGNVFFSPRSIFFFSKFCFVHFYLSEFYFCFPRVSRRLCTQPRSFSAHYADAVWRTVRYWSGVESPRLCSLGLSCFSGGRIRKFALFEEGWAVSAKWIPGCRQTWINIPLSPKNTVSYDSINHEALQLRTPSIKCKVESMCKMFSLEAF